MSLSSIFADEIGTLCRAADSVKQIRKSAKQRNGRLNSFISLQEVQMLTGFKQELNQTLLVPLHADAVLADYSRKIKTLARNICDDISELVAIYFCSGKTQSCFSRRWATWWPFCRFREVQKHLRILQEALKEFSSIRSLLQETLWDGEALKVVAGQPTLKVRDILPESSLDIYGDKFFPPIIAFEIPDHVVLDFESTCTVEGALKSKVLERGDSFVVAASDAKANGVGGMGGVGKTVAMKGLSDLPDIKSRFDGGVYFLSFGQEATKEKVIEEISRIVEESGGLQYSQLVSTAQSPAQASIAAAKWFSGKACLFLCDDLWATECDTGFFYDLTFLVRCDRRSRMVITTRDANISKEADVVVRFGPRDPTGPISRAMLFQHARIIDKWEKLELEEGLRELLELCGGLPLLLAIVGRRLADDSSIDRVVVRMRSQVKEIETELRRIRLRRVSDNYPLKLHAAVISSVKFLARTVDPPKEYPLEEMFQSLSLLSNQGWMPITVLSRLWKTDAYKYVMHFNRLRLVTLQSRSWKIHRTFEEREEVGVTLHDLTLDICRFEASLGKGIKSWHQALLDSYHEAEAGQKNGFQNGRARFALSLGDKHRPWWSDAVPEDGYIHSNVSRHLMAAGRQKELWSLLLNPKWSNVWIRFGTFLPLQRGLISLLEGVLYIPNMSKGNRNKLAELKLIYNTLRCAWGRIANVPREYPYQMLGRLSDARRRMQVVDFFLKQVETTAERPWLRPLNQCLEDPTEGPEMEIYFETSCSSIAYFPCGTTVAAAVSNEVRVIDLHYGTVLKNCIGHRGHVRKVAVSSNGAWVVSADDQDIRVWAKKTGCQIGRKIYCDNSIKPNDGSLVIREGSNDLEIFATVMQEVEAWKPFSEKKVLYNIDEPTSYIAFSADGRELVCATAYTQAVCVLNMDDMPAKTEEMNCPPKCGYVSCLAVSEDCKSIACGTHAGEIVFWDRMGIESRAEVLPGHRGAVITLAITKNAKLLFSGSNDGGVRMWDLKNRDQPGILIGRHSDWVTSLATSPDSARLVSGARDNTMRVWDVTKKLYLGDGNRRPNRHSGPITCISSSSDGHFVISGSEDRKVRVWDAENGKPVGQPFTGHKDPIEQVAVSSDSTIIYSFSGIEALCWNVKTRAPCPLRYFTKANCSDKDDHPLSLQRKGNNAVECLYKLSGEEIMLAQMPTQEKRLPWHIDQDREIVHVGRQDGRIMVLKVES